MIPGQYVYVANSNGDFLPEPRKLLAVLDQPYHGCKYIVATSAEAGGVRAFPIAVDAKTHTPYLHSVTFLNNKTSLGNITEMKLKIEWDKTPTETRTDEEIYHEAHKASGLKVGDYVRVVRKPEDHEAGWENAAPSCMSTRVGKVFRIAKDHGPHGFLLEDDWTYPYFVLEKTTQNHFLEQQVRDSGLKVGDWVEVTRAWSDSEFTSFGWTEEKRKWVGKKFKVKVIGDVFIGLETGSLRYYIAPAFVLKKTTEPEKSYVEKQEASGLKVGDYVRVTRKAENREAGWDNVWMPGDMNPAVGKVFKIESINGKRGIRLSDQRWMDYPFFVLEKTDKYAYLKQLTDDSNIKKDDWVKVIRTWTDEECQTPRCSPAKEAMVGKTFKVDTKAIWWFNLDTGKDDYSFPPFVLEKTDPPKVQPTEKDIGKEVFVVNTIHPGVKIKLHAIVNNYAVVDSAYAGGTPVVYPLKDVFLA